MKRTFVFVAAMLLTTLTAAAQEFDGSWSGVLVFGRQSLQLIFDIADGQVIVKSPDQSSIQIPATSATYDGAHIEITVEPMLMTYSGTRISDDKIDGVFEQNGIRIPLLLTKGEKAVADRPQGPQEPQPPYPYTEEEVTFCSKESGITLHGTLTLPADTSVPCAGVVLVTGSGTQNRDEEIFGHKPFKVIADYLSRRGIAVLRYDDREYTLFRYDGATTLNYAHDAAGAVEYLRSRQETDNSRIGIIGHSEGGTIGFICAAEDPDLSFVISLAGMTVDGKTCIVEQNRVLLEAAGTDSSTVATICETIGRVFDAIKDLPLETIRTEAVQITDRAIAQSDHTALPEPMRKNMVMTLSEMNEWQLYFLCCDPAESIRRVTCPVLALNGSKDTQVNADMNLGRLKEFPNLEERLTTVKFENLNHLFQHCESGSVAEYAAITETFSEEVLEFITAWINAL